MNSQKYKFVSQHLMRAILSLFVAAIVSGNILQQAHALGEGTAPWVGDSFRGTPCTGSNAGNFGPWDYTRSQDKLPVVHNAHFTTRVEQLQGGENAAGPTSDLDYVLKVCPNHHRALNSALLFHYGDERQQYKSFQDKNVPGYKLHTPVECYLQRAINYSPKDSVSRMLYAGLLHRSDHLDLAKKQYDIARKLSPNSPNIEYNYALLLVDMEEYNEAKEIAQSLYSKGFPLPGLKNKLVHANMWE
jgi:hypothetical protein